MRKSALCTECRNHLYQQKCQQKQAARPSRRQPRREQQACRSALVLAGGGRWHSGLLPQHICAVMPPSRGQQEDAVAPQAASGRNLPVAADSSEDSKYALQWTVRELYSPGDVIHVAHCIPCVPMAGGMYTVPDGRLAMVDVDHLLANEEQYLLVEQQTLERTCEEAFKEQQVAHVVDILREEPLGSSEKGRIADTLCHKADELQAAVLVIASQAKSRLSEFLLGSVAAYCTAHSPRPVLVLHAPNRLEHRPPGILSRLASAAALVLGGSSRLQQGAVAAAAVQQQKRASGRNIVLAVDDSEESEKACSWAVHNLYRPDDTFHLLRIIPTLPYRATYGSPMLDGMVFYMEPPTDAFKTATARFMQHRFEPKLQEAGVRYKVEIIAEDVDESVAGVGEAICHKADELQAAVVVLGSHMSGGLLQFMLGSVSTYVAHHCRQPVAVLH